MRNPLIDPRPGDVLIGWGKTEGPITITAYREVNGGTVKFVSGGQNERSESLLYWRRLAKAAVVTKMEGKEVVQKLTCADCPAPYGEDGWCDVVIPHETWNAIAPEGGVLCFRCITKRIEAHGLKNVPVIVTSGPYV